MSLYLPVLAVGFMAPALFAAGAAATSIPIVIHLLNKRKFRIVIWAAMEFLLAAQRRNARRLKFQRWLLLAVRCLALLALAAAVGQLILENNAFGLFGNGQGGIVVILDDSYSMGHQRPGTSSAFVNSKKLLNNWLQKLSSADKVMLIRAGRGGIVSGNRPTPDKQGLESQLKALEVTDAGTDLPAALDQAAEALKDMERTLRSREVIILTDLSNSSIHDPVRGTGAANVGTRVQGLDSERLKKAVEAVKAHATSFRVIDMGSNDQVNMGITDLKAERPIVVAGTPSKFSITVMNAKEQPEVDVPVDILLDGVPVQTEKISRIDAGSPRTVMVTVTVPTPGRHLIEARLQSQLDFVPNDDVRRLMVDVKQEIPILLVDGNPGDNKTLGSTQYLQFAYTFPAQGKPGGVFSTKDITELELPTTALQTYAAVVLSDTGAPRNNLVRDNLKKYVDDGGLLMILPGGHTEAEAMNTILGDSGARLLPATIGQPIDVPAGAPFAPEGFTHPVLSLFREASLAGEDVGFNTVQTTRYLKLGVPTDGSSEVVLRYAKEDAKPGDAAVVMKAVEKGKVVLFASSADTSWNTFGAKPSYLPFIHELTYYGMSREAGGLTLNIGDKINLPAEIENPGAWNGPRGTRLTVNSELDKDGHQRLTSLALPAAGVYGPEGHNVIAVNADAQEVDIRRVTPAAMASSLGIETRDILVAPKEIQAGAAVAVAQSNLGGSNLARNMLIATLGLFMLETILARWFSVYR